MKIFIGFLLFVAFFASANTIYKYQDENGRWHFTDKPPTTNAQAETVEYKSGDKKSRQVKLYTSRENDMTHLVAENLMYAPAQIIVKPTKQSTESRSWVLEPQSTKILESSSEGIKPFVYTWTLGDPDKPLAAQEYFWPMDISLCPEISQSFFGRFSHHNIYNRYAVDIAANVGTNILAARDGVIVVAKDDYALGGVDEFFMDKANYIQVYHEDGTWALYAHILLGSAVVKPGDKVRVGDVLAKSGSSGYSSGPHLHFVIQKNIGMKVESLAFTFKTAKGNITPQVGQKLCNF